MVEDLGSFYIQEQKENVNISSEADHCGIILFGEHLLDEMAQHPEAFLQSREATSSLSPLQRKYDVSMLRPWQYPTFELRLVSLGYFE
jgi:hypothetical protein